MGEPKKLYCPKCGRRAGTYDGRSTMNHAVKCGKCKNLVVYNPNEDRIYNAAVPLPTSSIGRRYY